MAISDSSRAILNVELARLRGEKQRVQKLIDGLKVQFDDSLKQMAGIDESINKIKGDVNVNQVSRL